MARSIKWNKRAVFQLDQIVNYLEKQEAHKAIGNLIRQIDNLLNKLSK